MVIFLSLINQMQQKEDFTISMNHIIDYLFAHPEHLPSFSITDLANATYTSTATIVRLCKKLGVKGFQEFRVKFALEMDAYLKKDKQLEIQTPITNKDTTYTIINKIAKLEMESIELTRSSLDYEQLQMIAMNLSKAKQIDFYGTGINLYAGMIASFHFMRAGKSSTALNSVYELQINALNSDASRVAIVLSNTGENEDLIKIARALKGNHVFTIVITRIKNSTLARLSDETILIVGRNQFQDMATLSYKASMNVVLDILFALLFSKNFENNLKNIDAYAESFHKK